MNSRNHTFTHALVFVLGFGLVFTLLGLSVGVSGAWLLARYPQSSVSEVSSVLHTLCVTDDPGLFRLPEWDIAGWAGGRNRLAGQTAQ